MLKRDAWLKVLFCLVFVSVLAPMAYQPFARAEDPDPNDPAVRKAGKTKMTPEELYRIRIAELEGGAIAESLKTPEAVTLQGPPLTEKEKVIHVLNRLSFGWRPGEIDEVAKAGGWE